MFRIGQGFDVHQLVENRPLIIGGITIPFDKGLLGHSDADVLLHAVADACLGAIGEGDIGKHFPDTDQAFKDADSGKLLQHVWNLVKEQRIRASQCRLYNHCSTTENGTICTRNERKYCEFIRDWVENLMLKQQPQKNSGFVGREEGIASQVVVLLKKVSQYDLDCESMIEGLIYG